MRKHKDQFAIVLFVVFSLIFLVLIRGCLDLRQF